MSIYDRDYMKKQKPSGSQHSEPRKPFFEDPNDEDKPEFYLVQIPKGLKKDLLKLLIIGFILLTFLCYPEVAIVGAMIIFIILVLKN